MLALREIYIEVLPTFSKFIMEKTQKLIISNHDLFPTLLFAENLFFSMCVQKNSLSVSSCFKDHKQLG